MSKRIIDLRKASSLNNTVKKVLLVSSVAPDAAMLSQSKHLPMPPVSFVTPNSTPVLQSDSMPAPEVNHGFDLQWSCYEHEYRIRGPYWFLYPLIAATIGMVFGIITRSYLFVIFVFVAFVLLTYYMKRPPRMRTYKIEKRGVWLEDTLMHYGKLKSFWIFTHALMAPELLLETGRPINPFLSIRLEGINPEEVKHVISRYLPEKEHSDTAFDQIARIIGF